MWARVLDVPAALSARRYAVELDVVLDVHDPFLDRGGRFRLRGGPDGAECDRVDAAPARRSRIEHGRARVAAVRRPARRHPGPRRPGAGRRTRRLLRRFDVAMLADREPQHGTEF